LHDHFVCHFFPALVLFEESNCIDWLMFCFIQSQT
jgi:hypothetical protein